MTERDILIYRFTSLKDMAFRHQTAHSRGRRTIRAAGGDRQGTRPDRRRCCRQHAGSEPANAWFQASEVAAASMARVHGRPGERCPGRDAVAIHLFDQCLSGLEFFFAPDPGGKLDIDRLAVEIASEIENEHFQKRRSVVEGRPAPIRRDRVMRRCRRSRCGRRRSRGAVRSHPANADWPWDSPGCGPACRRARRSSARSSDSPGAQPRFRLPSDRRSRIALEDTAAPARCKGGTISTPRPSRWPCSRNMAGDPSRPRPKWKSSPTATARSPSVPMSRRDMKSGALVPASTPSNVRTTAPESPMRCASASFRGSGVSRKSGWSGRKYERG